MASLKEISRRITGITSTRKITRAMKMVAAAKMRRAQENMEMARPYSSKLREVIASLVIHSEPDKHPLLAVREPRKIGVVCVTSDRGMAGGFNASICRRTDAVLQEHKNQDVELICLGRKGYDFFRKRGHKIFKYYPSIFHELDIEHTSAIGATIKNLYIGGRFDQFLVVFNEFKNAMQQTVICEQFLPIIPQEQMSTWKAVDYIYEPDASGVLEKLLPLYVNDEIWHVLLESYASEQAARMTAMDKATENADELIETLTLKFNKARQTAITKELLEIVAGAESLK